ncbi:transformation/transcription domain-associated protein-like [Impatiens glandulifera]|uniref:transformation/transcription domain-associated protein-like n=1 Tax=Impatiens glandulifera TaxID=253017 RepID=UPI001FB07F8E|nr:transformation/transcription domain-associated protein-like [Impatiens glandulifera]
MSPIQNLEQHSRHLIEPDIPIQARLQMAIEVRDSLEITHTGEYLQFLKCYFRAFSAIMYQITKPQFVDNPEHKLRNIVLEILNRLPHSEVLRPFVQDLLKVAMHVLTTDNEENGLICIRIIFDLLRNFRPTLENEVQPFLDFVCKIYQNFRLTVSHFFESGAVAPPALTTASLANNAFGSMGGEDNKLIDVSDPSALPSNFVGAGQLNSSTCSFKIVTETPLVVMFIFQLYSRLVQTNIPHLLPLMVVAISVPGPEKIPPHLKGHFIELKGAQVKTVSFLTYLLKSFADYIRPHEESICKSIVNLLVTCSDSVSIRKELLVALKHVLGTDFKRGLFPLIDTLLEERVLVGTGRACFETLRPLAYSLLAEIVHHVRAELSLRQLSRIIYLFSSNMHDASLSLSIHTTCARLMLNLVEPIFEKGVDQSSMDEARILLDRILDAFVGKFNTFKHTIPQLLEEGEEGKERCTLRAKLELPIQAVLNLQVPVEHSKEVTDCKHLIKTLVMGMKTIIWSITHTHLPRTQSSMSTVGASAQVPATPSSSSSVPQPFKGLREDEVWKASGVLKNGVHCLALFKDKDEEREMIHLFSQILAIMEPRDLMDIFSLCMPELFDSMITNTQLVHIFSTLLQMPKVFRPFADVLVNFLVNSKLEMLKHPDSPEAKLVLHLFRFLFGAVAKAPSECERILQPHVLVIMETCMKNTTEVGKPLGYLHLLRTMFRALAGGKFELLLRDLIPMLQPCLNMLLTMLEGPTAEDTRDLLLELCLTLPARLSSLLPHISRLMRPLVLCLKGSDDLVSLGLRTLEFWIDSLNPDFLEPSMANVMSEVILALWSHLRPAPYTWGVKSLQLLGKLGGRNIRFLKEPLTLECKEIPEHGLRLILTFEPSTPFLVPLDRFVNLAVMAVMQKNGVVDPFYRKQALKFLRVCLSSQLNLPGIITDEGTTAKQLSNTLVSPAYPSWRRSDSSDKADLGVKTKTQLMAEKSVFKILLMTIIAASAETDLCDPKDDFIVNICRHFAMIFHMENLSANASSTSHGGSILSSNVSSSSRSRLNSISDLKELDPLIFLDALVEVLADENRLHAKAALSALNVFSETLIFLARTKHTDSLMPRGGPGTPMIVSSPSMSPVYSPPPSVRVPVFDQLLPRLLHCCYGVTWQAQVGGVMGLGALVGKVTVETMCVFQVRIVRGLVYVLKRLPMYASKEQEETSQVLTQVLRVVNNVDEANSEARRQSFQGVVEYLASELLNSNSSVNVRKIVQSCLSLLASRTGSEVSELLENLHQPYLQNLITRPLRSKTVDQQVGTVTALNFCLALRPPLLKLTPELVNFLQEALQLAEADESVWAVKIVNPKVATSLNKLRTACIELLCTAMAWADFKAQNHSELRAKIISMFFKSLTSKIPEIVAVAKEGLRQVILQQRMPKELLQSSLRPILVNLAHTKNLSMPLLQGLARLLELLSTWFNVTLGGKLLEHLKKWLEPEKLAQCQKAWKAGEEPKIAAAIIELFHLLPSAAGKFLDELVTLTIDLEAALPPGQFYSEINSPYLLPLTKFLNRYSSAAVDYFLARLSQPKYFRRFMYIIRSDAGQPLREELAKSPEKILNSAFNEFMPKSEISNGQSLSSPAALIGEEGLVTLTEGSNQPSATMVINSDAYFQGLALVKSLVKLMPGWLQSNRVVFDTLVLLWKSPARMARLQKEQELSLVQVKESKWLIKCFLNYLRYDKNEVVVLFDILSIFLFRTRIDFTFLKEFYIIEVAEGYPPDLKKTLLLHFLNLFQSKQLGHDHLVIVMQMLILPMLAHALKNGQSWEVIDTAIVKTIVDKLLDPPEEVSADYDESLRIELLQLATLLLKYLQNDLVNHRKELIKFGWNHLKREDSASKQWAFVNVCHFLEAYQAPEKIILQVFVALLRTCQPENKMLVKQALDILMPALPRRLPLGDSRMPIWIRYTKKILVEEGHSIPNLIHIFQLIVRHSELFYSCRAQFVPQMVNSLSRLGLPFNTTAENRRLAIELAGLVVVWEKQRQNEMKLIPDDNVSSLNPDGHHVSTTDGSSFVEDPSKRVKIEPGLQILGVLSPGGASSLPNMENPGTSGQPDEEFKPNAAMEEMIINFLIRVALVIEPKDNEATLMYKQALDLLSQALEVWPTANIKFNYLEKLLSSIQPSQSKDPSSALAQGLDVMNNVLEKQPHLFIRNNINHITQILEPCFKYKMLDAGKSLCSLLTMVFVAFPLEAATTPPDVKILYQKVEELIQKNLAVTAPSSSGEDSSGITISFVLYVTRSLAEVQKNLIDPFHLVRVLQRLARDMGSAAGSNYRQSQRSDPDAAVTPRQGADVGLVISNLKSVLKLISDKVMLVPDCKRSIIQVLNSMLSEKSTDVTVLLCILDVIKCWIQEDFSKPGIPVGSSTFLSPKEAASLLHKLSQVDRQSFTPGVLEEWDGQYLELLYGMCADSNKYPFTLRQEVFQKVERQFLLGLRAKDPNMRMKFFSLYHESLGKTLFTRLQYIIQIQDWEALGDIFWLKQGLDLLLAVLVEDKTITLAPNSARVRHLVNSNSLLDSSGVQPMVTDVTEGSEETPLTFDNLVSRHAQFLNGMSQLQVADLIIPLRELAHSDANIAYHLWVLVFPIVWVTLQKDEQVALAKPMINLLSKDYHKRQQGSRPNVMQALLEGLQLSHPQPRMPSELIKYIGKTYNAWHTALALLESHVMLFLNDTKCSESLAELYRLLNEEDMRCGLWKKRSVTAETRSGLSLVQHGYWQQAQSLFYQAMVKATQGTYNNTVPKAEMCLWEEQWLNCATQLSQWDVLGEFGKAVDNYEILLDSLWKQPDWAFLKDQVIPKAQVEETPKHHIIQAYFALHEKNTNGVGDAENIVEKGCHLALEQWWQLPEMSVHSRIPLLQQFQQLVEVQESSRIIIDIANGNKHSGNSVVGGQGGVYADVKDILETWRLRTPNEWDNLSVWYDLLQWRNEMYNIVIDAFKDFGTTNSQLHHLGYRDKAWNVNKLAHIVRKQGLYDVCVTILEKMYGLSTMEVQEAFVKIREQAKALLETKGELSNGYALLNSTNLEYFPVKHKAEIFRLKGDFLLKLKDCETANKVYSQAISLFKNLPKGWISWGNYCNLAYIETHEDIWLEYAVSCFLQGIKFGVSNSRSHLARVLYLLSFDTPNEPVGRAFDKYLDQIPLWVWLSWIPQLLLSLQRTEATHCKLVLLKVATMYPQALYYWLRTYLLERRDVANKTEIGRLAMAQQRMQQNASGASSIHGGPSLASDNQGSQSSAGVGSQDGGNSQMQDSERSTVGEGNMYSGNDQTPQSAASDGQSALRRNGALSLVASAATAFDAAKDIMEALRGKHNNMAAELELLLTEIGSRFVTLPEERLLAVVNALLHRCYKYPTATTAEVPQSLKKELSGVCKACFSADAVNKHVEFVREYKQDFERDLDPESTATFPFTLSELTERLKHWKNVLQSNVEDRFPPVLKLEEESKVLRDFNVVDVEVPGQYFSDQEVAPDHTVKLDRVGADIPIVRRHGSSFRRLTLIGSDGSQRHFIVQTSLTPNARSDERILQIFRVMNRMFDKHKESRRRHISIHTPIIIPVWSQVRMVEDDLMYSTFLEVYENHCARNDREADQPITYFKEQLNQAISGQISPEAVLDLRLQAYTDITKNLVSESILSQYMYKTLPSGNHMWAFKKQFANQLALSSFMSFMLQIGGRSPNKVLFAKNTGKIFQTDFHPAYDGNGMIEFNEPVPFRLTRNFQAFFSQIGVEGLIVSAMSAASQAVISPKQSQHLWHHLAMFFRDELLSWSWRRPLGMPLAPVVGGGGGGMNPADFKLKVTTNVDQVIGRIKGISPQYFSEEEDNGVDQSVQKGVIELVEAALTPRNLCMMDPTWHPWF